jgi:voltage-gated potassium channel
VAGGPEKPNSIDRIQRLEKVELERLERRAKLDQLREAKIATARGEVDNRILAVDRFEHRANLPMTAVGIGWAVVFVMVLTGTARGSTNEALVAVLFVLWAIVVIEYVVRLVMTPDTARYVSSRKLEPAIVVVPFFQYWRFFGVEKVGLVVTEGVLRTRAILLHRGLFRVLLAAAGLLFLGSWLVLLAESNAKGSNIHNYGDALWWGIVTVTTVGYGDRFPITDMGRSVAVVLMLVGIGLIGVLTATVASFFVQEHTDANKEQLQASHAAIGDQLGVLTDRLANLEGLLGAPAGDATVGSAAPPSEGAAPVGDGMPRASPAATPSASGSDP